MTTTLKIAKNPNFIQDEKDLNPPIDLDYFPNCMGINLCSVASETWTRRDDGQLEEIIIKFIPSEVKNDSNN